MLFYTGDKYPGWKGSVFVGGLASMALVRLELRGDSVVKEERYLGELHEGHGVTFATEKNSPNAYLPYKRNPDTLARRMSGTRGLTRKSTAPRA